MLNIGAVGKCNIYIPLEACMVWEVENMINK